jgi:hypothetical protein
MRRAFLTILFVCLLANAIVAQKKSGLMGDMWTGVVESANETTREITIVNPDKKTERFTGVLVDGYMLPMIDGSKRELKMADVKPGLRVRAFYKSKTQDVAGQKTKVNVINRFQFLGIDEYTRLRQMLKVESSIPVSKAAAPELPTKDPFKLFLAFEPQGVDKGLVVWVDQWNKEQSAKYGRVEIVNELAQADASLVVIWGDDDSYIALPVMMGFEGSDPSYHGFGTAYLATKNAGELRVLSQLRIAVEMKQPDLTGIFLGKQLEKRLKAREK